MIGIGRWRARGIRQLPIQSLTASNVQRCSPASSLSAIHRGLRQSERARYDENAITLGARRKRSPGPSRRSTLTSKAEDGVSSPRQLHKLRKKLRKAEEEFPTTGRQTRRKRFLNPEKSFGKKSLVYQMKHGVLREDLAHINVREPVRPAPFRSLKAEKIGRSGASKGRGRKDDDGWSLPERPLHRDSGLSPEPKTEFERISGRERLARAEKSKDAEQSGPAQWSPSRKRFDEPQRPLDQDKFAERFFKTERVPGRERSLRQKRSPGPENDAKPERSFRGFRASPRDADSQINQSKNFDDRSEIRDKEEDDARGWKKAMVPPTIKYTTAASQFLYGKSVVKAALDSSRRKLYNLYVYAGASRKESLEDTIISRAAERHGVPITMVPSGEQSMMDKMSMGRPHNGFVLEASPIPQLPVTSLGRLEESPGKLGFHVELDYQSKEEEAINGRSSYIARKNNVTAKPFVLLLNEIMDPGNLGGLLRTASYLGVDAVGITSRSTSTLTPVVLKSAAGAAEEVTVFTVDSPLEFIERSKVAGWKTYAAVPPPASKLAKMHENKFLSVEEIEQRNPLSEDPCILILGNEGFGLSKPMKVAADYELSIPRFVQHSCVDSLNVSVAAGLLCHAFVKASGHQDVKARSRPREMVSRTERAQGDEESARGEGDEAGLF